MLPPIPAPPSPVITSAPVVVLILIFPEFETMLLPTIRLPIIIPLVIVVLPLSWPNINSVTPSTIGPGVSKCQNCPV